MSLTSGTTGPDVLAIAALQAQHNATLAERDATIAGLMAELAAKDAEITEKDKMIQTLGGTELGQQMTRDAARKAHEDTIARAREALAELDKETTAS